MTLNTRVIAAVLAVIGLSGAFYVFALKPKREQAATLAKQIDDQQAKLDAARTLLATNQQARGQYQQAYAAVVRLGKAVPADDDVKSLMVQLDSAAKHAKVDFRSIDVGGTSGGAAAASSAATGSATTLPPGATVGPAGFPIMPFSFAFTGSFFDLGDFFHHLQTLVRERGDQLAVSGRLLTLDGLTLAPDSTGFPHIRATVDATSYLVSPLEGATGGATAAGPGTATAASGSGTTTPPASGGSGTGSGGVATSTATSTGAIR